MITDALIRQKSGQYDPEIVTRLRLDGLGIRQISNLDRCESLVELSLSQNNIMEISNLDRLCNLQKLTLSFNKIKYIGNLDYLSALEFLDIRANLIDNLDELKGICGLSCLRSLYLRSNDGSDSNPACSNPAYLSYVTRILPMINILDGGHIGLIEATTTLDDMLNSISADETTKTPLPVEKWFDSNECDIDTSSSSIDHDIHTVDCFVAVNDFSEKIMDVLKEDCSHLLRKAQQAIGKAQAI